MSFLVDQTIIVSVDGRINPKREDVLVVRSQHTGVYDCTPGYLKTVINRLCADDAGSSDFILDLTSLIEDEGHDIFVVGDSDD